MDSVRSRVACPCAYVGSHRRRRSSFAGLARLSLAHAAHLQMLRVPRDQESAFVMRLVASAARQYEIQCIMTAAVLAMDHVM
jgi:hypothetical protein